MVSMTSTMSFRCRLEYPQQKIVSKNLLHVDQTVDTVKNDLSKVGSAETLGSINFYRNGYYGLKRLYNLFKITSIKILSAVVMLITG